MPDVRIAVVPFDSPTSTGTLDVVDTSGKLGGVTPTAVLIFGGDILADGTASGNARWLIGMAVNGGNSRCVSGWDEDNQTSTDCNAFWSNTNVIAPAQGSIFASVSSWIADGVRLNFSAVLGVACRYYAVLIAGADVSAYVDQLDMTSGWTSPQDITAPGFAPELVLVTQCHTTSVNANTGITTHYHMGWGAAYPVGSPQSTAYAAIALGHGDLLSAPAPAARAADDCVAMSLSGGTVNWRLQLTDFDANGFTATTTASVGGGTVRVMYMALNLGGLPFSVDFFNAETTTGQQGYTGLGFTPQAALLAGIPGTAINTAYADAEGSSGLAFGAFDDAEQSALSCRVRYDVDPSDTDRIALARAMIWPTSTDVDATIADFVSMDADGFTLDYTAASGAGELFMALAFGEGDSVAAAGVRASQIATLALGRISPPVRVSQIATLALAEIYPDLRVSQIATLALVKATPCLTYRARLFKLTRLDATVFAYTDHDRDLVMNGTTFKACASLAASATETFAEADEAGDTQLTGFFDADEITEADIFAGLFDGASVEIWEVSWNQAADPMLPRRLAAGIVGRIKQSESRFTAEARSPGALLTQRPLLQTVTPHCRFELFDSRCGLDRADWLETGSVTNLVAPNGFRQASFRQFVDSSRAEAAGYFDIGKITWTSGANAGLSSEVKSFSAGGGFILWEPLPSAIAVGDAYEVTPGCDFLKATCRDKFDNLVNFGGFAEVPGADAIVKSPNAKQ